MGPDTAEIQGTVSTFSGAVPDLIERRMREIATHTSAAFGAGCELTFERRAPAVVNHTGPAQFAARVMSTIVGADPVRVQEPSMASTYRVRLVQAWLADPNPDAARCAPS